MCAVYSSDMTAGDCTWNAINSRLIQCWPGYTMSNTTELLSITMFGIGEATCLDLDECRLGYWASRPSNNTGNTCSKQETCLNKIGSFECCDHGFAASNDGSKCLDVNECVNGEFASKNSSNTGKPCSGTFWPPPSRPPS